MYTFIITQQYAIMKISLHFQTLENAVTILDDIEEWPADVIDQQTNQ